MSILAVLPFKTRKITKNVQRASTKPQVRKKCRKNLKKLSNTVPKQSIQMDAQTKQEIVSPLQNNRQISQFSFKTFQSFNPYTLGSINSITYSTYKFDLVNGRFYDLLYIKKEGSYLQKSVKCKCFKSKCSAKYCECFSKGQACGLKCECHDCQNLINQNLNLKKHIDRFCKCSRSGCQKKYCECLERGDACSSKCQCSSCKNTSGKVVIDQM